MSQKNVRINNLCNVFARRQCEKVLLINNDHVSSTCGLSTNSKLLARKHRQDMSKDFQCKNKKLTVETKVTSIFMKNPKKI